MILTLLRMLFGTLIGKVPPAKKEELMCQFNKLLETAIKAAAAGAVQGAMKQ